MITFLEFLNEASKNDKTELKYPEFKVGTILHHGYEHFWKITKRTASSITYVELEREFKKGFCTPTNNVDKKNSAPVTSQFVKDYEMTGKQYIYVKWFGHKVSATLWDGKPVDVEANRTFDAYRD